MAVINTTWSHLRAGCVVLTLKAYLKVTFMAARRKVFPRCSSLGITRKVHIFKTLVSSTAVREELLPDLEYLNAVTVLVSVRNHVFVRVEGDDGLLLTRMTTL